jgi:hypothetical protein
MPIKRSFLKILRDVTKPILFVLVGIGIGEY